MTLFECSTSAYPSSDPISWDIWVKSSGAVCNSNLLTPRDWDACITPVAVWTISSTGKCLPTSCIYFAGNWMLKLIVLYRCKEKEKNMVTEFRDRDEVVTNEIEAHTNDDQLSSISGINYHNCICTTFIWLFKFNNMVHISSLVISTTNTP